MTTTYRCQRECPIGKSCYICKVNRKLPDDTEFLVKCQYFKHDIQIAAKDAIEKKTK